MKRLILTGTLALAAGLTLMAQPAAQPAGPAPKSKAEAEAMQAQGNPDATIKAADDLLTKFADTQFKEMALLVEANAYQAKNDNVKALIYAEQVVGVNPKSFQAELMIGEILAGQTRENDLDK